MSDKDILKQVENLYLGLKDDFKELRKLESAVETKKNEMADSVLVELNKIEFTDKQLNDYDFIWNFRYEVQDLAGRLGMVWNGDPDQYGDWEPGKEIEFWTPSNC